MLQIEKSVRETRLLIKDRKSGELLSKSLLSVPLKMERVDGFLAVSSFP